MPLPQSALASSGADRPARVFRVAQQAPALADAAQTIALTSLPSAPRRTRRVAEGKRPGPVTHVVRHVAAPAGAAHTPTAPHRSGADEIAALRALMKALDAVLDDIAQARAFRLIG